MMLSPDVKIIDLDATGWINLLSLLNKTTAYKILGETPPPSREKNRLFIIHQGDTVLKAWHSKKGSILQGFKWEGPDKLEELAKREGVDRIALMSRGSIGHIFDQFQRRIDMRDDYIKQISQIYDAIRNEFGGGLRFQPPRKLPNIGYEAARKTFKLFVPAKGSMVLYIFDKQRVWTSLIVGITDGNIDLITSHDALLADGFGFFNWREDYPKFMDAVGRLFSEPTIGIFADLVSFLRVLRSKTPLNALAAAQKDNDIILEHIPVRLKTLLSAGKLLGR